MQSIIRALEGRRNWYLDLSNERNVQDRRFTSFADLRALREAARSLAPDLLVTASHAGDLSREELEEYLKIVDFITPHRPRRSGSAGETESKSRQYLEWMREIGRVVPLFYQEPFRRGFGKWEPAAGEFAADLAGARAGGAAGWCFHNGPEGADPEGRPRRSFDLRERGLFDGLDAEERKFLAGLPAPGAAPEDGGTSRDGEGERSALPKRI